MSLWQCYKVEGHYVEYHNAECRYDECLNAECHYHACCILGVAMLKVVIVNTIMLFCCLLLW